MSIHSGFEVRYSSKATEAPASIIQKLNKNFGIIFECSNGKIINVTREKKKTEYKA